ncbi:hypothetical protein D3C85_1542930 [compost metagenome]
MQFADIFQRVVGFTGFVVVDKAKRVVEMGDLAHVQFVDITAGAGSHITTAVKVADGHQIGGEKVWRAEQG